MKAAQRSGDERGFTLVELLVAITILGIIMVAIGAMITTAFRTTTIVSNRLNASRAPKLVSTYWVPDVEGAESVNVGAGGCGDGGTPLVTFQWTDYSSVVATEAPPVVPLTPNASATWAIITRGTRTQVVRRECRGVGVTRVATVVPDLVPDLGTDSVTVDATGSRITVSVPDRTNADKQFHFTVDGARQVAQP
jgi:prepilin-type N-terminal cleavage/methylation domain